MPRTPVERLYWAIQATRPLLRHITARVEADLEGTGISVGQRAILEVLLGMDEATAPEITRALDVKRQFVGREIKEMAELGLVDAADNPRHRSSKVYRLSKRSRPVIEAIRAREMKQIAKFAENFDPSEIVAFEKIQKALLEEFSP